jgi:hypothetical protein
MITVSENCFFSDKLKEDKKHIIHKLKAGDPKSRFYVVYKNGDNGRFELMHGVYFRNRILQVSDIFVYGITANKDEAVELLADIYTENEGLILDNDEDD